MSFKEVSRNAATAFFRRHAIESEHGFPKKADKYIFLTKNSVPRGYIAVSSRKDGIRIQSIFVRPEDRRKGYGSKLIGYVTYNMLSVYAEAYDENAAFFTACGMSLDMFSECRHPDRRVYSKSR